MRQRPIWKRDGIPITPTRRCRLLLTSSSARHGRKANSPDDDLPPHQAGAAGCAQHLATYCPGQRAGCRQIHRLTDAPFPHGPYQDVRVKEDHLSTSQPSGGSTDVSISPTIFTTPSKRPRKSSEESSAGTSL